MGTPTVGDNGLEPLRLARRAAEECELPLMVHVAFGPPAIEDVLAADAARRHPHALLHRARR